MSIPAVESDVLETLVLDRAAFQALAPEWPALLARTGHDAPFYAHGFLRCGLDAFFHGCPVRAVVARDARGLRAALVLVERTVRYAGVAARQLSSAASVHSGRFDLIADAGDAPAIDAVWRAVEGLDWDALVLADLPPRERALGAGRALVDRAQARGFSVGWWESMRTPFIPLGASADEVFARQLQAKFRSNLRRRRKKLQAQGEVRLQRLTGGPELAARLAEGLALEASGWKGRAGTAIATDPPARRFYLSLARSAEADGTLAVFTLRAGGRAVAFHFALVQGGVCHLPKMGFDEAMAQAAPGHLILESVLQDCCARGLSEFDFLGPDMAWKRDWTRQVRVHHWGHVYRPGLRGRALHAMKFAIAPRVKRLWGQAGLGIHRT